MNNPNIYQINQLIIEDENYEPCCAIKFKDPLEFDIDNIYIKGFIVSDVEEHKKEKHLRLTFEDCNIFDVYDINIVTEMFIDTIKEAVEISNSEINANDFFDTIYDTIKNIIKPDYIEFEDNQ